MARTDSDMTQGTIWKHLIQFSIPMAVGLLFQQLYNTVDTVVVGQFVGQEAQAAVGSTGSIINTIVASARVWPPALRSLSPSATGPMTARA